MMKLRDRIFTGRHFKLQALLVCVLGWCFAVFFYGMFTFVDAPYNYCGDGQYCGKRGGIYAYETYQAWKRWEGVLFASWPFGMLASVGLSRLRKQPS